MTRLSRLAASLLAAALLLQGCGVVVVGAGTAAAYSSYDDRRSTGTQMEDEGIELRAMNRIDSRYGFKVHVNVTSFNRSVLITGEVPDAQVREEVGKMVAGAGNVRAVANELEIASTTSLAARTNDSLVTSNVKARFLTAKGFSTNHVKVVTEAGVVFLMGVVTEAESNAAADVARTTDGVRKVVKVFEYCKSGETLCRPVEPKPAADKPKPAA
jgi:osmotically-inducible protein OsmY